MYEMNMGVEIHIELNTKSKIFCSCKTTFGAKPNTQICPICIGMPGALPVLNQQVVELALRAGLALHCKINQYCRFDRKNYFYPDNPQNYQISQLYLPLCYEGCVDIIVDKEIKKIGIHEIHMEEDAGKLIHEDDSPYSLIDYNRSGVALIEIVTKPDFSNADEVIIFLETVRGIMQYLGVSDCKLQEGSMRVDVNLSVKKIGTLALGTRTEMKNLNSFKAIKRAIVEERDRQITLLESGQEVIQETRRWDDKKGVSYAMRSKEDAKDYRYFPEPDVPPLQITDRWLNQIKASQPELLLERIKRFQEVYLLSEYDARLICSYKRLAEFFEEVVNHCQRPKKVVNWLLGEHLKWARELQQDPEKVDYQAAYLAQIIQLIDQGDINQSIAKDVFEQVFKENIEPQLYIEANDLKVGTDVDYLKTIIDIVLVENQKVVAEYLSGKEKVIGYLVGQGMKKSQGKLNPKQIEEELKLKIKN